MDLPPFQVLARAPAPRLDLLALALAAEFRPALDATAALTQLDAYGAQVAAQPGDDPHDQIAALSRVLHAVHGFTGDTEDYDAPVNSMLDAVLERRRGLPILLSVVYVEVARRAGIPLYGVGLPGHFVAGHFGGPQPVLCDPFGGGRVVESNAPRDLVRPWSALETALRMLNNLVAAYGRRGDLGGAITAARLRLAVGDDPALRTELRALQARLN